MATRVGCVLVVVLSLLLLPVLPSRGQFAAEQAPPPLWVHFGGPKGMKVTFYRGTMKPATHTAPFTAALRPGYIYRIKLADIPGRPGMTLHPTLEVRGSLRSEHKFHARDYPVTLTFTEDDFQAIGPSALLTKVIALERQDMALPVATRADRPLEFNVLGADEAVKAAGERGIPLVVVRVGERTVSEDELRRSGIDNTILLPGDTSIGVPRVPPCLPWACPSLYDPRLGGDTLWADICIADGGDTGLRAGHDFLGRLQGVEPSDTVAEFVDAKGRRRVACSNRVCVCVPRFIVFRSEVRLEDRFAYQGPFVRQNLIGTAVKMQEVPVLAQQQKLQPVGMGSKVALSEVLAFQGLIMTGVVDGVRVTTKVEGPQGVSAVCKDVEEKDLPERPLLVIKFPDKCGALIGEIVTFTIRYMNLGRTPIRDVVLHDNLATRFEYVAGSAKTDRPANFTTQANGAGSDILRWEILGELPPGASGTVTFQVRIR